jgi:flagellar biosynthesis/type III secretory pathway M-ring protein FliF/YscJ
VDYYYYNRSGLILYSSAYLLEYLQDNPNKWYEHIIKRNLTNINFDIEDNSGNGDWFNRLINDPNTAYIILIIAVICVMVVADVIIIWRVRKRKEERAYQEYLQTKRMSKNLVSTDDGKTKNNEKISSQ